MLAPRRPLARPQPDAVDYDEGAIDGVSWARTRADGGGIVAAATTANHREGSARTHERIVAYVADPARVPDPARAVERARAAAEAGGDTLLAEHRAAWAARWADARISIEGDPDSEIATRLAIFNLLAAVASEGEAAVGARGMTGGAYGGRVFWDADVFMLPALAAMNPPAARAMLEYRIRRLPAARDEAAARGYEGALFPWESAADGHEAAPRFVRSPHGIVPIYTGEHAEHVTSDVAWAAWRYAEWTGDADFLLGPGRALIIEPARYWASRVRITRDGHGHLYGVVGPDEYHRVVDDNAFTNVMARWTLKRAADLVERDGVGGTPEEAARWRAVAASLVDGYDLETRIYEEFAGFHRLEEVLVAGICDRPAAADMLFGHTRVARSQIVKQADVLMLHHMVPEEVARDSLIANLDFYEPRTSHGSSLSPPIHAALLARADRADHALETFRMSSRLDLDDLTGTSVAGLHLATFGGLWQALVDGFAGVRPRAGVLHVDPHLPSAWDALEVRFRAQGQAVGLRIAADEIAIDCDGPLRVVVAGRRRVVSADGVRLERGDDGWREAPG